MELLYLFTPSAELHETKSKSKATSFPRLRWRAARSVSNGKSQADRISYYTLEQYLKMPQYPGNCAGVKATAIVINSNHQLWTRIPDYIQGIVRLVKASKFHDLLFPVLYTPNRWVLKHHNALEYACGTSLHLESLPAGCTHTDASQPVEAALATRLETVQDSTWHKRAGVDEHPHWLYP